MRIYFIEDEVTIASKEFGDIANLEAFGRELDEMYPDGWSYDFDDLDTTIDDDMFEGTESDIY